MLWRRQRNASLQNLFPEKCSIFFLRVGPVYLSSAKIVSVPYQINALPGGDEIEGSNWIMSALLLIHKILTREISTIEQKSSGNWTKEKLSSDRSHRDSSKYVFSRLLMHCFTGTETCLCFFCFLFFYSGFVFKVPG